MRLQLSSEPANRITCVRFGSVSGLGRKAHLERHTQSTAQMLCSNDGERQMWFEKKHLGLFHLNVPMPRAWFEADASAATIDTEFARLSDTSAHYHSLLSHWPPGNETPIHFGAYRTLPSGYFHRR